MDCSQQHVRQQFWQWKTGLITLLKNEIVLAHWRSLGYRWLLPINNPAVSVRMWLGTAQLAWGPAMRLSVSRG